jgi:hypothetical protein
MAGRAEIFNDSREATLVRSREYVRMTMVSSTTMIQNNDRDAKSKPRRMHERISIALPLILRTSDREVQRGRIHTRVLMYVSIRGEYFQLMNSSLIHTV